MKKISRKKTIYFYYLLVLTVIIAQSIFSCVRLGQTVSYQHKLNFLENQKVSLQKEKEEKIAKLSQIDSLLANQLTLDESYSPISSALVISKHDTIALK